MDNIITAAGTYNILFNKVNSAVIGKCSTVSHVVAYPKWPGREREGGMERLVPYLHWQMIFDYFS